MARGNQREKAREKTQKEAAGQTAHQTWTELTQPFPALQKKKNSQSGTEFARTKENQAAIMRAKQDAANARKAAEAGGKK
ncbi:hypothetical protein FQN53_006755 [Emmonsiellopsis sp. PD_33]|nr:hypothetical protein FQN53_006755 [Emmonsiellopsis sp. PD_33]